MCSVKQAFCGPILSAVCERVLSVSYAPCEPTLSGSVCVCVCSLSVKHIVLGSVCLCVYSLFVKLLVGQLFCVHVQSISFTLEGVYMCTCIYSLQILY